MAVKETVKFRKKNKNQPYYVPSKISLWSLTRKRRRSLPTQNYLGQYLQDLRVQICAILNWCCSDPKLGNGPFRRLSFNPQCRSPIRYVFLARVIDHSQEKSPVHARLSSVLHLACERVSNAELAIHPRNQSWAFEGNNPVLLGHPPCSLSRREIYSTNILWSESIYLDSSHATDCTSRQLKWTLLTNMRCGCMDVWS